MQISKVFDSFVKSMTQRPKPPVHHAYMTNFNNFRGYIFSVPFTESIDDSDGTASESVQIKQEK